MNASLLKFLTMYNSKTGLFSSLFPEMNPGAEQEVLDSK
jgi:hypothetical protein